MTSGSLIQRLLARPAVRYVAVRRGRTLQLRQRAGIVGASAAASDTFEEMVVNPTALVLLTQRGDIDCGGLEYLVIRYGNFFQFIHPIPDGHVSVALEPDAEVLAEVGAIRPQIRSWSAAPQDEA